MSFCKIAISLILLISTITIRAENHIHETLTDQQTRQIIIQNSIQAYAGSCPCPYNLDRRERLCGARSAWSKPGGKSPLCYPNDITPELIENFHHTARPK